MTIKIVGAGFGRTGTMSMKLALEQLGLGKCHHMEEVFDNPWQLPHWQRFTRGETPDWNTVLSGYSCTVDWPSAHFWRQIHRDHPGSKVILTVRPVDDWWESYASTIREFMTIASTGDVPDLPRAISEMCMDLVGKQTFGSDYADESAGKAAFLKRIEDVKSTVRAEDLLIYEVGSGWPPL